jgi:hypothetical protein
MKIGGITVLPTTMSNFTSRSVEPAPAFKTHCSATESTHKHWKHVVAAVEPKNYQQSGLKTLSVPMRNRWIVSRRKPLSEEITAQTP